MDRIVIMQLNICNRFAAAFWWIRPIPNSEISITRKSKRNWTNVNQLDCFCSMLDSLSLRTVNEFNYSLTSSPLSNFTSYRRLSSRLQPPYNSALYVIAISHWLRMTEGGISANSNVVRAGSRWLIRALTASINHVFTSVSLGGCILSAHRAISGMCTSQRMIRRKEGN